MLCTGPSRFCTVGNSINLCDDAIISVPDNFHHYSAMNVVGTSSINFGDFSGLSAPFLDFRRRFVPSHPVEPCNLASRKAPFSRAIWSERRDSNSRPPVPQTGALTGLRYAPNGADYSEGLDRLQPAPRTGPCSAKTSHGCATGGDSQGAIAKCIAPTLLIRFCWIGSFSAKRCPPFSAGRITLC
jgi:hypothetical protein